MGNVPGKKVVNADSGDSDHVGGNDWDDLVDFLNNVNKTGPVKINTPFYFRSGILGFRNPADTFQYNIVIPAIITSNKNINYPLLTGDDTPVFLNLSQIFTQDQTIQKNLFPNFTLYRDANLSIGDKVGHYLQGKNASGTKKDLAYIYTRVEDPTNATEDAAVAADVITAGTVTNILYATGADFWIFADNASQIDMNSGGLTADRVIKFPNRSATLPGLATSSGTTNDINTNNTEQDMLNYSVGGNQMGANGFVRFTITGYILQNQATATDYTLKVKFGTTIMYQDLLASALAQSATKLPFRIEGEIFNKNATNAQGLSMKVMMNDTAAITTGLGDITDDEEQVSGVGDSEGADTAKDTTANQTLQVTITMSVSNAAVHTVIKHAFVEVFTF